MVFALVAPAVTTLAVMSAPDTAVASRTKEQRAVDYVNAYRVSAGLPRLVIRTELTTAARLHANDMARRRVMTHTGSDGSDAGTRIWRAGYRWRTWAENVAAGYPSPESVARAWLNSSGHRTNIMNPGIYQVGVAYTISSNGTVYWTMDLATRRT